jgi:acyl carrier protein
MSHKANGELTATEKLVSLIWASELALTDICPDSDFFELGGDSLRMLNVLFRIGEMLGVDMMPGALFEQPTLRGFCRSIDVVRTDTFVSVGTDVIEGAL